MPTLNLLYKHHYQLNDDIKIMIPRVGEIIDDEDNYYQMVTMLTAMPIDLMVQLDQAGIDFTEITDYDLFLLMFPSLQKLDTSLIFGNLDLKKFRIDVSKQNGSFIVINDTDTVWIDRLLHGRIAATLRKIHHLEKNTRKPANKEVQEYLLERAKEKAKRRKNSTEQSQLEQLIIAMVNTEQYKYDFEGTRELSIYQFNESVRQVVKKVDYDNKMYGVYTGTISVKDLSQDELNWVIHK